MAQRGVAAVGRFELWMLASVAMGLVGIGGVLFLVPAYVLNQGGTPADAGAVMAIGSGLALTGPAFGAFADRFRAHRLVQLLSMALIGGSALLLPFTNQELTWLLAAALVGFGIAGLSVVNPTMVIAAGFSGTEQASKLALLQMGVPIGQVIGLASVSALSGIGWDFGQLFFALAGVMALLMAVVAATNRPAAARIQAVAALEHANSPVTLRRILGSQFGLVFLIALLMTMSSQALESQYPNYMQESFNIDTAVSAGALSVIVLLSLPLYPVAARWTARRGFKGGVLLAAFARLAAALALLSLPRDSGLAPLIAYAFVMLVFPFFELNVATAAAQTSPIGAGAGQGAIGAAMALGTLFAAVLAGWLAEQFGFPTLPIVTAISAGSALMLGALFLRNARGAK